MYRPRPTAGRVSRGGRAPRHRYRSPQTAPTADVRVGYARCSHLTQERQSQLDALVAHGIGRDKIFAEKVSTRVRVRPKFEAALDACRQIKCLRSAELTALADHLVLRDEDARHSSWRSTDPVHERQCSNRVGHRTKSRLT